MYLIYLEFYELFKEKLYLKELVGASKPHSQTQNIPEAFEDLAIFTAFKVAPHLGHFLSYIPAFVVVEIFAAFLGAILSSDYNQIHKVALYHSFLKNSIGF